MAHPELHPTVLYSMIKELHRRISRMEICLFEASPEKGQELLEEWKNEQG